MPAADLRLLQETVEMLPVELFASVTTSLKRAVNEIGPLQSLPITYGTFGLLREN